MAVDRRGEDVPGNRSLIVERALALTGASSNRIDAAFHCVSPRPDTAGCASGSSNHSAAEAHGEAHPSALAHPVETTERIVGLVVLLLAATLVSLFPFSHIIPALVIVLISFAYLEEDGVLLWISLGAALGSLAITSATVWATIRATDLLERLLGAT